MKRYCLCNKIFVCLLKNLCFGQPSTSQQQQKMSQQYTDKIKSEFGPVLTFFGVTPSGNLFKDITNLSVRENITKQTLCRV